MPTKGNTMCFGVQPPSPLHQHCHLRAIIMLGDSLKYKKQDPASPGSMGSLQVMGWARGVVQAGMCLCPPLTGGFPCAWGDFGVRLLLVLGASGCSQGCAEDSSSVSQRILELPWPPVRAGCNGNISKFFWMRKIPQAAPLQRKFGMAEMFGVRGCLLLFTLNCNTGG